jgi:tetraacyldisaccharide 4'-kinase
LGRLREPLSALHRSDVFVVTRAESELRFRTICDELRKHNASAPVFRTRLLARNWREYPTGDCVEVKQQPVAAFCGLGNPQNFWDTLDSLGLNVVFRWAFEDHHTYRPVELQYFGQQATLYGAKLLVTTEKDRMNFPGHLTRGVMVAPLVWLEIELELQDSAAFFSFIESTLRRRSAA